MPSPYEPPPFTWRRKFAYAFRGIAVGVRGERSFWIHITAAIAVVTAGWALGCGWIEWCVLFLAIGGVFAAELFNSALEKLADAITGEASPHIRDALDIAAGAVFFAAVTSVAVGLTVFGYRAWLLWSA